MSKKLRIKGFSAVSEAPNKLMVIKIERQRRYFILFAKHLKLDELSSLERKDHFALTNIDFTLLHKRRYLNNYAQIEIELEETDLFLRCKHQNATVAFNLKS